MEGRLAIELEIDGDGVIGVRVQSTRPVHASAAFNGKAVAEVQKMIPLLYSICATAQACAGVRAMEQAMGLYADAATERSRDQLVNMETLREHLWRILLDWPAATNDQPDKPGMAEVVAIQRAYQSALCPEGALFCVKAVMQEPASDRLTGLRDRLLKLLHLQVFGMPVERWIEVGSHERLIAWSESGETAAARLIARVILEGWGNAGACESTPLPHLSDAQLDREMRRAAFIEQPQWRGGCCETTSLTRTDSPLLDDLKRRFENGLLVRLVGRLQEVATLAVGLLPGQVVEPAPPGWEASRPAIGIGQVAAARGQLVHRVKLVGDEVGDYRILAPTEWNFHPDGVLARALASLRGSVEQIELQARLLINAIDPCVGYDLVVAGEAR